RHTVVADPGLAAKLRELRAAVQRKPQDGERVAPRAMRQAFEQESQTPGPLTPVGAEPEQQRRVLPPQPPEDLPRRSGIRPRLRVGDGYLPAIGETRLH